MERETENRHAIIAAASLMNSPGLSQGASGNVSVRHQVGLLSTAASRSPEAMRTNDTRVAGADGPVKGLRPPSGARRFHQDIPGTLALGKTPLLSEVQIAAVIDRIAGYGLTAKDGT